MLEFGISERGPEGRRSLIKSLSNRLRRLVC
jgi:hypothetical protein